MKKNLVELDGQDFSEAFRIFKEEEFGKKIFKLLEESQKKFFNKDREGKVSFLLIVALVLKLRLSLGPINRAILDELIKDAESSSEFKNV